MIDVWQKRRSEFNHDWIKNEYLKNLDGLIVRMQTRRAITETMEIEIQAYLSAWEKRHPDLEDLLDTAEDSLSPRPLFEKEPLIHCLPEHKAWMVSLFHDLWIFRSGIRTKIAEIRKLVSKADRLRDQLESECTQNEGVVRILSMFETFTDTVKELSSLLSSFPYKVTII